MSLEDATLFCERVLSDVQLSQKIDELKRGEDSFDKMAAIGAKAGLSFSGDELREVIRQLRQLDLVQRINVTRRLNSSSEHVSAGWTMDEHWGVAAKRG